MRQKNNRRPTIHRTNTAAEGSGGLWRFRSSLWGGFGVLGTGMVVYCGWWGSCSGVVRRCCRLPGGAGCHGPLSPFSVLLQAAVAAARGCLGIVLLRVAVEALCARVVCSRMQLLGHRASVCGCW